MAFSLVRPRTVEEAVRAAADGEAVVPIAGGTDLLLDLDDGRVRPSRLLSLALLPWNRLELVDGTLEIGSTLPLRRIELDPRVATALPGLFEAVRAVGSVPLRHRATLGGNLARASPASDLLPILLALEARVRLVGATGRREVALDRFVRSSRSVDLGPGELIEAVILPSRAPSAYVWQRVRPANDISQVGVAVARPPGASRWNLALGGVLPRPTRSSLAEEHLGAVRPTAAEIAGASDAAAREATFPTDRRASEEYRRSLVSVLVRRAMERAVRSGDP